MEWDELDKEIDRIGSVLEVAWQQGKVEWGIEEDENQANLQLRKKGKNETETIVIWE